MENISGKLLLGVIDKFKTIIFIFFFLFCLCVFFTLISAYYTDLNAVFTIETDETHRKAKLISEAYKIEGDFSDFNITVFFKLLTRYQNINRQFENF